MQAGGLYRYSRYIVQIRTPAMCRFYSHLDKFIILTNASFCGYVNKAYCDIQSWTRLTFVLEATCPIFNTVVQSLLKAARITLQGDCTPPHSLIRPPRGVWHGENFRPPCILPYIPAKTFCVLYCIPDNAPIILSCFVRTSSFLDSWWRKSSIEQSADLDGIKFIKNPFQISDHLKRDWTS